ncbi:hypothetical protein [Streptomyces sp. NPDC056061]|uniref:hypothetical protein n=1 Tax=Streptomyces sp. NPDC056061 TaxID=3345700 RepID=UPI0035E2954E
MTAGTLRGALNRLEIHARGNARRPPTAARVEDIRDRLRDPAVARGILDLNGLHARVRQVVLGTPGARELIGNLVSYAMLPAGPQGAAIGCVGGRTGRAAWPRFLATAFVS